MDAAWLGFGLTAHQFLSLAVVLLQLVLEVFGLVEDFFFGVGFGGEERIRHLLPIPPHIYPIKPAYLSAGAAAPSRFLRLCLLLGSHQNNSKELFIYLVFDPGLPFVVRDVELLGALVELRCVDGADSVHLRAVHLYTLASELEEFEHGVAVEEVIQLIQIFQVSDR